MNRFLPLIIGSLLLALGCGGNDGPGGNEGATGPSIATLVITTTTLPTAAPTVAYSQALVATGGDGNYTWSVTVGSLPTGLSLNTSGGLISGTPSGASSTFTVQVASGDAQADTQVLSITVNAPLAVTTTSLPAGFENEDYGTVTLTATGADGTYTWSVAVGSLPTGLSLATSGDITGTPTVAGSFDFTVRVISGGQVATRQLTIDVYDFPLVATVTVTPPSNTVDLGQTAQLTATARDAQGDTVPGPPIGWLSSNPAVAIVSSSGLVTGMAPGSADITATVDGRSGTAGMTVNELPIRLGARLVAAGTHHSCAITGAGTYCWGDNFIGQLGDATTITRLLPVPVVGAPAFVAINAGSTHTCGLTPTGSAYCWGDNQFAQLGDGTLTNATTPVPVGGGLVFVDMASDWAHTCGLTAAGRAYCWGFNPWGSIGDGTTTDRPLPTLVAGNLTFVSITVGPHYSCGLTPDGTRYCWGQNGTYFRFGAGTTADALTPVAVTVGPVVTQLALIGGLRHNCEVASGGAAYCWGDNNFGQVGDGTFTTPSVPTAVSGGLLFASITLGDDHTCGLTASGSSYCWGSNDAGKLGDGTQARRRTPVLVQGGLTFTSMALGAGHTCAMTSGSTVYCWGNNGQGATGQGALGSQLTPAVVSIP